MTMDENNPLITSEMFATKFEELRTTVSGLDGDQLTRAYNTISVIAQTPHLYDVHDGMWIGENPNLIIQTNIAGPVPLAPKAGSVPILIPRPPEIDSGTDIVAGPLPQTGSGITVTCPHCQQSIAIVLK